jgi:hypothetical protein
VIKTRTRLVFASDGTDAEGVHAKLYPRGETTFDKGTLTGCKTPGLAKC